MEFGGSAGTHDSTRSTLREVRFQLKREIVIDGKTFQVEINECPIGSPFQVKINGKTREVQLEQQLEPTNFTVKVDSESYAVELPALERNSPFSINVNSIPFRAEIKTTTPKMVVSVPSIVSVQIQKPTRAAAEGAVVAPMAGKIVSVKVKKGDSVKMGAVLCVLEAMKMENEITAPKSGVVEQIVVQQGKAVNEGDVLIVIK